MIAILGWSLGCSGASLGFVAQPDPPSGPDVFDCAAPAARIRLGPDEDANRWAEGTEVVQCRIEDAVADGPHVELWPEGGVAAQGAWLEGERHGTWRAWSTDGGLLQRVDFVRGVEHGTRRERSLDGRFLEMQLDRGKLVDLRALPQASTMPEWDHLTPTEGLRHQTPPAATEDATPPLPSLRGRCATARRCC